MQRKRNIQLLFILGILVAAIVGVYFSGERESASAVDPMRFQLGDYSTTDKVILESSAGTVELGFNGSRWRVSDSLLADRSMVEVLFATLAQATAKRTLGGKQGDSIAQQLEAGGIKVSLQQGDEEQQTFYAGGNAAKTQAYFMDPKERVPYVMQIPGYRVYVSGIFELPATGWRDKYVFGFNWQNFAELSVTFPGTPKDDFEVYLSDRMAHIRNMAQADTARLNTFLDAVSMLTTDAFEQSGDTIQSLPFMTIQVRDVGKRTYTLSLFQDNQRRGMYRGVIQGRDACLFSSGKLADIIHERAYFQGN